MILFPAFSYVLSISNRPIFSNAIRVEESTIADSGIRQLFVKIQIREFYMSIQKHVTI